MTTVNVTRRFVKKDYYESDKNYFSSFAGKVLHMEYDKIEGLTEALDSHDILIEYKNPFLEPPICITLDVYRMVARDANTLIKQDVLHYFPVNSLPNEQFLLTIDAIEPLDGVIIVYCFFE